MLFRGKIGNFEGCMRLTQAKTGIFTNLLISVVFKMEKNALYSVTV
jgi:hypothetical protein